MIFFKVSQNLSEAKFDLSVWVWWHLDEAEEPEESGVFCWASTITFMTDCLMSYCQGVLVLVYSGILVSHKEFSLKKLLKVTKISKNRKHNKTKQQQQQPKPVVLLLLNT